MNLCKLRFQHKTVQQAAKPVSVSHYSTSVSEHVAAIVLWCIGIVTIGRFELPYPHPVRFQELIEPFQPTKISVLPR